VTATLRIPAAEEEEAAVPVATRALRVLVAEDEPTNQVVVRAFLARLGHVATIVPDGLAALEALEDDVFDVVVTDLRMPRLDGAGLLRALRDRGTDHRVVLCTAEAGPDERALLDDLGADALLEKPFTLEGLASALRR
jgi:CheY-like chemotaxis protein